MVTALKLSGVALMFFLAFGGASIAQSNPGSEPAVEQRPEGASERKTIDGQPVYKIGHGVTPPRARFSPSAEYSEQARRAKYQGTCILQLIVDTNGNPRNIRVSRALGKGLDEKAIGAVKKWRFEPARKDGQPVAVQIDVEVSFRLY